MALLQRAIFVETTKILAIALIGTSSLLIFGGGLREGIRQGLPIIVALRTIPFLVPEMLRLTIPASLLFAICTVFGRMAAAEELTALKSLGISPMRVVTPTLVLASLLSMATFWLYDVCAIWSRPNLLQLAVNCVDEVVYNALRTDSVFKAAGITVSVSGVIDRRLIEPRVEVGGSAKRPTILLRAREATLDAIPGTGRVRLRCLDSRIKMLGKVVAITYPNEFDQELQIRPDSNTDEQDKSPAELRMTAIPKQIQLEKHRVAELQRQLDAGDESRQGEYGYRRERLYRLQAETQRRLSNGCAVLAFAMIGIPVSVWWKSADNMTIFFTCFAPIALVYYPLLAAGESIARNGVTPSLSVWLAPAVLVAAGMILFGSIVRR